VPIFDSGSTESVRLLTGSSHVRSHRPAHNRRRLPRPDGVTTRRSALGRPSGPWKVRPEGLVEAARWSAVIGGADQHCHVRATGPACARSRTASDLLASVDHHALLWPWREPAGRTMGRAIAGENDVMTELPPRHGLLDAPVLSVDDRCVGGYGLGHEHMFPYPHRFRFSVVAPWHWKRLPLRGKAPEADQAAWRSRLDPALPRRPTPHATRPCEQPPVADAAGRPFVAHERIGRFADQPASVLASVILGVRASEDRR
jgi:hypothetical protein